jgi:hypothetical protein
MGSTWDNMNNQSRRSASTLTGRDVPTEPGVYAWYRDSQPIYAGRACGAAGLRGRVWKNHLGTGADLSRSSFRRNVCEYLGIAPTSRTTIRPTVMTANDVQPVNKRIQGCEIAWITATDSDDAKQLELSLLAEWMPPLSRR